MAFKPFPLCFPSPWFHKVETFESVVKGGLRKLSPESDNTHLRPEGIKTSFFTCSGCCSGEKIIHVISSLQSSPRGFWSSSSQSLIINQIKSSLQTRNLQRTAACRLITLTNHSFLQNKLLLKLGQASGLPQIC